MNFRSSHRLNSKVGGQNHLNDDVLFESGNRWGVPEMGAIQKSFIKSMKPFSHKGESEGVHFFVEDFTLNRVWNRVNFYGEKFKDFDLVLTPDFSLFTDMPLSLQIFNTYRNRYIGKAWQEMGLNVAPSVTWSDERSFEFCFAGIPENSVVAISTQGARDREKFFAGFEEMIKTCTPAQILVYGTSRYVSEIESFGIDCLFFQTHFEQKRNGWKG